MAKNKLVAARTGLKGDEAPKEGFSPLSEDVETRDHKAYYPHAEWVKQTFESPLVCFA